MNRLFFLNYCTNTSTYRQTDMHGREIHKTSPSFKYLTFFRKIFALTEGVPIYEQNPMNASCKIPTKMSDYVQVFMFSQTVVTFPDTNFHKTPFRRFRVATFIQTDER